MRKFLPQLKPLLLSFIPITLLVIWFCIIQIFPPLQTTPALAAPTVTGPLALDTTQVVTGNVAVTAIAASSAYNGCYIQNDPNATTNLVVDPVGVASSTTPLSTASFITPGNTWSCPYSTQVKVTVTSSDASHKFYGIKY